jgi:glutamine amidotransferase
MKRVAIIDYQLGNLFSVQHACKAVGLAGELTSDPTDLAHADGLILPGVGAFADAMQNLHSLGLYEPILEFVRSGKPFMGVCLGMQLLFDESEEFGISPGLGLIPGRIRKFAADGAAFPEKVPQIGWNRIAPPLPGAWETSPLKGMAEGAFMYFVHSYYADPADEAHVLAWTTYGPQRFCSAVQKDNIFATQFHPEKSAAQGVRIYKTWSQHLYS